jgi:hypothetical protein
MISLTKTRRDFCVFPHDPIAAVPVRDPVMLRGQQLVDRHAKAGVGESSRAAACRWFDRLMETVRGVAMDGELDQLESADDLVRERFARWCEYRTATLRKIRHRGVPARLRHLETDLPLTAAMMRLSVSIRGDDLTQRPGRYAARRRS